MGKKERFAFYLTPEKKAILERRFQEDGSRSMTAFVERAVDFYLDYLSANDAGLFLPTSIKSYLDGRLGQLEERLSSIAFRQAVEQDMVAGNQMPVQRCQYCGSDDLGLGWQHGEAIVTFKKHGLLGNRLRYLICRRCGAVVYQWVAEPHRFPPIK